MCSLPDANFQSPFARNGFRDNIHPHPINPYQSIIYQYPAPTFPTLSPRPSLGGNLHLSATPQQALRLCVTPNPAVQPWPTMINNVQRCPTSNWHLVGWQELKRMRRDEERWREMKRDEERWREMRWAKRRENKPEKRREGKRDEKRDEKKTRRENRDEKRREKIRRGEKGWDEKR